ncbi:hypothetical protein [Paraburkholderia azotifigens]|uniref:Uncharacterized protein n=1 Tax=Paraburkholderia azotifigens TaxID=2057004 RepID=A0A5C6V596_9BURK|nr:hypothetical protein [Paraburkholderia azotifigens]TXC79646.1 hypothetical protein FRZ40_35395 [Paraburkholderia azotifigens]
MKETLPESESGWFERVTGFIERFPARTAGFLVAFALLTPLCSTAFCQPKSPADDQDLNVVLGDPRIQRQAEFRIPQRYDPEIIDGYRFRLVLDSSSMLPEPRPRDFKMNNRLLDIQVEAYPKNGTMADRVVDGSYRAKKIGEKDGYVIYSQPLGKKSPPTKVFAYVDSQGNNVIVEDSEWAIRYEIIHGVEPYYVMTCFFSKKIDMDFREIDKIVVKLISDMYVR